MADSGTNRNKSPVQEEEEDPSAITRPDSDDCSGPTTVKSGGAVVPETTTKKRKKCPQALDKVRHERQSHIARPPDEGLDDQSQTAHSSFTFDTNFIAWSPQFTPKFGSFFCSGDPVPEHRERTEEERGGSDVSGRSESRAAEKASSSPCVVVGTKELEE